jgi:ribosomal protein S18 acetylase RimI-like enzyme
MVQIRKLEDRDIAPFVAWRGGDAYKNDLIAAEIAEHFAGARSIFVAVDGDALVGTVQFVSRHSDPAMGDGASTAYLQALEVLSAHRGRGIATRLMRMVESEAERRGFDRLTLMVEPDNVPAIRLYEAMGFAFFKSSTDIWRGKEYPVQCFEKSLPGQV